MKLWHWLTHGNLLLIRKSIDRVLDKMIMCGVHQGLLLLEYTKPISLFYSVNYHAILVIDQLPVLGIIVCQNVWITAPTFYKLVCKLCAPDLPCSYIC